MDSTSFESIEGSLDSAPPTKGLYSTGYFSALLTAIRAANLNVPVDTAILQSILLCLVAPGMSNRNLILAAKEEDLNLVQNLAAAILSKIFGHSTQKVKSRSKQTAQELLHALFLHSGSSPRRRQASRRSTRNVHRSSSDPGEVTADWSSLAPGADQSQRRPRVRPLEVQTDPSPPTLKDCESSSSSQGITNDQMLLPKAIVITGLEHSGPAQRALLQVLAEECVTIEDHVDTVWHLPEEFMIVYVCPLDLRDRPKIHPALLDRFCMSVAVSPGASVRQAYALVRTDLQTPLTPSTPIISQTDIGYLHSLPVHFHPSLLLHLSDLITAVRHHRELDGTLLTTRTHKDAEALIRAHRLLVGDTGATDLIRSIEKKAEVDDFDETDFMTPIQEFYDDGEPGRISMDSFENKKKYLENEGRESEDEDYDDSVLRRIRNRDQRIDISEIDIATVIPKVLAHRLRVRDGPDHEIFSSAVFPAAAPYPQSGFQKRNIKDILVSLFSHERKKMNT